MFDNNPFDFLAIVIAIVALIFARKAINQATALRERLDLMQRLAQAAAAQPVPPPLPVAQAFEQASAPVSPDISPTPPPIIPDVESIAPAAPPQAEAPNDAAAPPPPLPQPDPGFEETLGTRWVVWIGGLTLAL